MHITPLSPSDKRGVTGFFDILYDAAANFTTSLALKYPTSNK